MGGSEGFGLAVAGKPNGHSSSKPGLALARANGAHLDGRGAARHGAQPVAGGVPCELN